MLRTAHKFASLAILFLLARPALAYTVTNTFDAGEGSLRYAIDYANTNPGPDVISFNIGTGDPGFTGVYWSIKPATALPAVRDDNTVIDGYTQDNAEYATETTPAVESGWTEPGDRWGQSSQETI